jgi:hypothetical protein
MRAYQGFHLRLMILIVAALVFNQPNRAAAQQTVSEGARDDE